MKKVAIILLAWPLCGCASYYHSTLEDSGLCCTTFDNLHGTPQRPEKGLSKAGEDAQWLSAHVFDPPLSKSVLMVLKAPETFEKNPGNFDKAASMGVFVTGLQLDAQSKFTLKATLQWPADESTIRRCNPNPVVPLASAANWTVALVAREGGADDTYDLSRLQLSFKTSGPNVDLRAQQIDGTNLDPGSNTTRVSDRKQDISPEDHWKIFCLGEPFTLTLSIDRKDGTGKATIEGAGISYPPLDITLTDQFAAGSGPLLSTAGVALANAFTPNETVSVRVRDLKIWKE